MLRNIFRTTLLLTLTTLSMAACATRPANLDLSLTRESTSGAYRVTLEPPQTPPPLNRIHSWMVKVADRTGSPVHAAVFEVGGGMPQHGHGFPTHPRITRELEPGTYLLEGMKFSMPGWWEIKLAIQGPQGSDSVIFNTVMASPHTAS
jgi:hypothetical protein